MRRVLFLSGLTALMTVSSGCQSCVNSLARFEAWKFNTCFGHHHRWCAPKPVPVPVCPPPPQVITIPAPAPVCAPACAPVATAPMTMVAPAPACAPACPQECPPICPPIDACNPCENGGPSFGGVEMTSASSNCNCANNSVPYDPGAATIGAPTLQPGEFTPQPGPITNN